MKKYWKAAGAGLLLAVCFCGIKNFIGYKFPNTSNGMQAAISEKKIDSLFLGSSLFRQGIDIMTLEQGLEGNSYVMSYNGNQPVQMKEELEMILRNDVEISNLYVDLYVYSSALRPAISDTRLIWDLDMEGKMSVFGDMVTYSQAGFTEFVDFFITSNNKYMVCYPLFQMVSKNEFYKGGNLRETLGSTKEVLDSLGTPGEREGIDETQKEALQDIIAICESRGINLCFVEIPKYKTLAEADYYIRLHKELEEVVETAQYVSAEQSGFDNTNPEYYQDLFHLSAKGRREYTGLLIERITGKEEER